MDTVGLPVARSTDIAARIEGIASGDPVDRAWLYDTFAPVLERRIRGRYGGDPNLDPQGLLHDLFVWCFRDDAAVLQLFLQRNPGALQSESRLRGYLWGLISGLVSNHRRSSRRAPELSSLDQAPMPHPAPGDPEQQQAERDAALRLLDCVQGAGSRLYAYLALRFVEGLTPDEIAQVMGWEKSRTYGMRASLNNAVKRCVEKLGLALLLAACLGLLASGCDRADGRLMDQVDIALRGHVDLVEGLPLFVGESARPGICLQAPVTRDTSGWRLSLWLRGADRPGARPSEPVARSGRTLCFELAATPGDGELCGELVDTFDGRRESIGCHPFRYTVEDPAQRELQERFVALMRQRSSMETDALIEHLAALGAQANQAGYPALAQRSRLVQIYYLRRSGRDASVERARELLDQPRDWPPHAHADSWIAQQAYERSTFALDVERRLERAWSDLDLAERHYARVADPRSITVAAKQAEVLWLAGSAGFARERLEQAMRACGDGGCAERFLLAAASTLAWLTLQDPDASDDALRAAEATMLDALESIAPESDPVEFANGRLNLAYARTRLGRDPGPDLDSAADWLNSTETEPERREWLRQWARLVEALGLLATGAVEQAEAICLDVAARSDAVELSSWALSCIAQARDRRGDSAAALDAAERALLLHELAADDPLRRRTPTGPGQRARDAFLAARLAVDLGRTAFAWDLLSALDRPAGSAASDCGAVSDAHWNQLLLELAALDAPAPRSTRSQRRVTRLGLLARAQQRVRERWACEIQFDEDAGRPAGLSLRAFASEGEVLVLSHAGGDDPPKLFRRSRFERRELQRVLRRIDQAVRERTVDAATWRVLTRPLADALLSDTAALGDSVSFSLHGMLQLVPVAALPLPSGEWLADRTLVIHRPAGGVRAMPEPAASASAPLFVVDPALNIPDGNQLAGTYRRMFPVATVLHGREATAARVQSALERASGLHVDAHARFDPLFPELTPLQLSDRDVPAAAFVDRAAGLGFVNLSVCGAARWPVTADSGRFGVAGMFARAGTPWVIAARADLPHGVATTFNRRFYGLLRDGESTAEAYRAALSSVRKRFAPAEWASLVLVSARRPQKVSRIARQADSTRAGSGT